MAKKKKNKTKRRMLVFGSGSILLLAVIFTWIGSYWAQIIDKYNEKNNLNESLVTLKENEEKLKVDVGKLEDPDYVARYAREKYMYSKDGEFIIRMPEE